MADYPLCAACQKDFSTPENRRFHAQTIACSECGPALQWLDAQGQALAIKEQALIACIKQLQAGKIVAVKGIGGYQLLVNAQDKVAVARLRISTGGNKGLHKGLHNKMLQTRTGQHNSQ
jgi:hydrogenase maturation protein HypF